MSALAMGTRRGRKDQSQQSSKFGSNQSLNGAGGYHPFYQLHPAWNNKPPDQQAGNQHQPQVQAVPLTQEHLMAHTEIMRQQHGYGPELYSPPPPLYGGYHQHKRSKSKDSGKNSKSSFWSKNKQRAKSEQRDKEREKDEKALRAEQILRYQKAKEAADKRDAAEKKKAEEADRKAQERKNTESPFSRDDKRRKSGDGLGHLKFWKSKRKSLTEAQSNEYTDKQKRISVAESLVQSTTPQLDPQIGTEQIHVHIVQAPEQAEIVSIPSTPVPEIPQTQIIITEPLPEPSLEPPLVTEELPTEKEPSSKKGSKRSKSADSFRMKSSDSGFYSSRSKSPESKLMDRNRNKSWKREKSLESIQSKGSMVKSSESVFSNGRKNSENGKTEKKSESKTSVAKSTDSLQQQNLEPVGNSASGLRMVSSTPANLHAMDRNNNGRRR
jgi:hypothetical protein